MGVYDPLRAWLKNQTVTVSFAGLEKVLGRALPPSARKHRSWWYNGSVGYHSQATAWHMAGWRVQSIDLVKERVTFEQRGR